MSRYTTIPHYGEHVKAFVTLIKFASFPVEKAFDDSDFKFATGAQGKQ